MEKKILIICYVHLYSMTSAFDYTTARVLEQIGQIRIGNVLKTQVIRTAFQRELGVANPNTFTIT